MGGAGVTSSFRSSKIDCYKNTSTAKRGPQPEDPHLLLCPSIRPDIFLILMFIFKNYALRGIKAI